jgi:hypothetical protein
MTEVMPFYKAAFEGDFHQAVKACPFTKPLLRIKLRGLKVPQIADKVELK